MRIKHAIAPVISDDENGKEVLFSLDDELAGVTLDGFTEESSGKAVVAIDTAFPLPFGAVDSPAKGLFLVVEGDADVSLNGLDVIQVRRGKLTSATNAPTAKLFIEGNFTSVTVTPKASAVASASTVKFRYALYGTPAV
jgi:hypothetical protein